MKRAEAPVRPATAWFLPGSDSARWLEELTRCGLAEVDTRLYVVPRSLSERTPAGLLVVPAQGRAPAAPPAGLACGQVGDRFFLPVDAQIIPPASPEEINALCRWPVLFFHPAFGLSGFESGSTLRLWDLLARPGMDTTDWNRARPGPPTVPALRSITFVSPPGLQPLFGEESRDIGSAAAEPLPPTPNELPDGLVSRTQRRLRKRLAEQIASLARRFPKAAHERTWLDKLERWAQQKVRVLTRELEQIRNKEVRRLLHLLETDPEEGLRHAISMNDFAYRGVNPPGTRLVKRDLDFNPGRLGGQVVDLWPLSHDLGLELSRRYRELANRELRLGRCRRAAYIFAELLGDLASAANALKQGRHFREAALLYEEKLGNLLEAASCLAEGGLFLEAIRRYEKLGCFLEVADLYERLGDTERAEAALRRVVEMHLASQDILEAARLVEQRLHKPDEALTMLESAWPDSAQAVECLRAQLELLGRLGRHSRALERLERLRRDPVLPARAVRLAQTLTQNAAQYPDQRVRHTSADFVRVIVGDRLAQPALGEGEARALVDALVQLAPQDRLLPRDGSRHMTTRREMAAHRRRSAPSAPAAGQGEVKLARYFELPRPIEWLQAHAEGRWFFAAGVTPQRLTLLRGSWEGEFQSVSWRYPASVLKPGLLVKPTRMGGRSVMLVPVAGESLPVKTFPAADLDFPGRCSAGTLPSLPYLVDAMAFDGLFCWSLHVASGRYILSCYAKSGELMQTWQVTDELTAGAECTATARPYLEVTSEWVALALGDRLAVMRAHGVFKRFQLPGQVTGLFSTLPHRQQGFVALLQHGAVMHWAGTGELITLDQDLSHPVGAFRGRGDVVLVSGQRGLLLDVGTRGLKRVLRLDLPESNPIAVTAASEPQQFAVFSAAGKVHVFHTPDF